MTRAAKHISASSHSLILTAAAVLVPRSRRAEWLSDWGSELWYVRQTGTQVRQRKSLTDRDELRFCLGAFWDALWVSCDTLKTKFRERFWLQSPLHCLLSLGGIAALLCSVLLYKPWLLSNLLRQTGFIPGECLIASLALLVLPSTISFAMTEHTSASHSRAGIARLRRWFFLSLKIAFVAMIAFWVCFYLTMLTGTVVFEADGLVAAYVMVLRWALIDQTRRCPTCLRRLNASTTIGRHSRILLDTCSAEYSCPEGHGTLHVPEVPTSFTPRRWRELDPAAPFRF